MSLNTEILDASIDDMFSFLPKLHCHFVAQTVTLTSQTHWLLCHVRHGPGGPPKVSSVRIGGYSWDGSGKSLKVHHLDKPETRLCLTYC